jgi:hypothetical protein
VDPVKLFEALVAEMGRKNSLRIALYLLTVYPDAAEELAVAAAKADPANGRRIAHTLALAGIDFGLEKAQVSALLHAVAKTVPPHRESILAVMEKPEAPPSPADLLGGEPNAKTFGKLSKKQQLAALQKVLTEAEEQCLTDYFNNPGGNAASKYATLDGACKDVIEALVGENIPPGQDVSDVIFQIFNDADDLPDFLADIDAAFGSP